MTTLPPAFLERPIAHRALHDRADLRPENSRAAVRAAMAAGYGVEIDLQLSADGVPMVFHDSLLGRLTGAEGAVAACSAAELGTLGLLGGAEGIPTLAEILALVDGRVPLLIEVKDQDGALGPGVGALERATAAALVGYDGPVALMSFNPTSVAALAEAAPALPRGHVTCGFAPRAWPGVPPERLARLARIDDLAATGACFVSHDHTDLARPRLAELKADGLPVLTWTIRSPEEEAAARRVADNITFEGYLP
ncbi:phosphodiesterase-like [Oceanicola granulosus HTCC2516]|uniref:Phosphodiesterase-like n=1 Tax=Oceanicola granulosus (strain ATCC BAA-861 / DSM 15982 / KCTC 12143 / HTCC2516) TaxID=314256 RepID=Q2CAK9_OCEGH|nr:glycerophosphodiester phosphodiesterase family protein [Oceanicola granulosus]EAR49704.1 phosphodiesterase-like [Oceanicola granulosus HTCC2516]